MKNIAIINSVIEKSTGKIGYGLHQFLLSKGYNSFYCYGYGDRMNDERLYRIDYYFERYVHALKSRMFGDQGFHSTLATKRLIKFLKKKEIDTIYGIGIHGYYLNEKLFFEFVSKNNIKFIYIMTEEYAYLGKCGYSNGCLNYKNGCGKCPQLKEYPKSLFFDRTKKIFEMKRKAYSSIEDIVFVGPEFTINSGKKSPLLSGKKTYILDESIDTNFYRPRQFDELKSSLGIKDDKIIIECIAPMSYERKGVKYFVELAKHFENDERFVFVHVGYDKNYCKLPSNYIAIGYERDQDRLAEYYSMADLFVFPSLLDTMPNACLEALSCGTPILCFNISGMHYLTDDIAGKYVQPRSVDELAQVVSITGKKSESISNYCREYAVSRYDRVKYYDKLCKIGELIKQ